jgi:hypothetical protein
MGLLLVILGAAIIFFDLVTKIYFPKEIWHASSSWRGNFNDDTHFCVGHNTVGFYFYKKPPSKHHCGGVDGKALFVWLW